MNVNFLYTFLAIKREKIIAEKSETSIKIKCIEPLFILSLCLPPSLFLSFLSPVRFRIMLCADKKEKGERFIDIIDREIPFSYNSYNNNFLIFYNQHKQV